MNSRDFMMIAIGFLGGYAYIRSQIDQSAIGKINNYTTRYGFPIY